LERWRAALPLLSAAWQQVDNGWFDMVPLPVLGSSRGFRELDWSPSVDAMTVIREVLSGMCHRDLGATPTLRHRSVSSAMRDLVTRGPVGQRNRL
jgi:UDP-glucose 4-epimerase